MTNTNNQATACAPTPTRVQIATDADMMMIRCQLDDGWGQPVLRTVHGTHSTLCFAIRVPCWGDLTTQTRSNIISSVTLIKHSKALSLSLSLLLSPSLPPSLLLPLPPLGSPPGNLNLHLKIAMIISGAAWHFQVRYMGLYS